MKRKVVMVIVLGGAALGLACRPGGDVAAPGSAEGRVAVSFVALGAGDGRLDAGVALYEPRRAGRLVWEGRTAEVGRVAPGRYDVLIEYAGQKYWLRGDDVTAGERVVKLPMATLTAVAKSGRGEGLAGEVAVFPAGGASRRPVMEGRVGEAVAVLAGSYDVRVVVQGRERWRRGITLEAGDDVTEVFIEPVGYLVAEAVDEHLEPLAAEVWVYSAASAHLPVAIAASGEPVALVPGRYDVAVHWQGRQDYAGALGVVANQTTTERFTFWRGKERP